MVDQNDTIIININDFKNDLTEFGQKVLFNTIVYNDLIIFYNKYERFYRANNFNLSHSPVIYELLCCGNLLLEEKEKKFIRF